MQERGFSRILKATFSHQALFSFQKMNKSSKVKEFYFSNMTVLIFKVHCMANKLLRLSWMPLGMFLASVSSSVNWRGCTGSLLSRSEMLCLCGLGWFIILSCQKVSISEATTIIWKNRNLITPWENLLLQIPWRWDCGQLNGYRHLKYLNSS